MQLIIDNKPALIKQGSSFEYVSENSLFTDADAYTLSITLPLADCPQNQAIFGNIERMDADSRHTRYDAALVDRGFCKTGVVSVIECTEKVVKCQFLEGRSAQNFDNSFDDVFINTMDLGKYPVSSLPSPSAYLRTIKDGANEVALPWVNDTGVVQNEIIADSTKYSWGADTVATGKLSFQPYLIVIAKRICDELGYTYDFSQWEKSPDVCFLVCNTLPAAWDIPDYARALPHWSVAEFFKELEKILVCEIVIDHKAKHISLVMDDSVDYLANQVMINDVVDAYTSEISYDDSMCRFKGVANIGYKDRSDNKWKYDDCQWLIDLFAQDKKYLIEFETEQDLMRWWLTTDTLPLKDKPRGVARGSLLHVKSTDRYSISKVVNAASEQYPNMTAYQEITVNRFGDIVYDKDSDNKIELGMVPACLDFTDTQHGYCLFLSPSGFSEDEEEDEYGYVQGVVFSTLMRGEPDDTAEYYDSILLAIWDGYSANSEYMQTVLNYKMPPAPAVDLRFNLKQRYANFISGIKVDPKEKMKVSWLSNSIPDVKAVFFIRGKRYLCEKITATFTENGMSQLLKGEFYLIV